MKGKRAVLKGKFHVSTEELRDAVVVAEQETVGKVKKSGNRKGKQALNMVAIDIDVEEDIEEEYDSDIDELGW
jgi:dissimilatory sulfite reductase (desulfoviridin) alpha/beta subunit